MATRPRLLLADDHVLVVAGMQKLLESEFELAGAVHDGHSLIAAVEQTAPDLVLLDISMPLLNGLDAARTIKRTKPSVKLLFVTMQADAAYVREAFRAGASGYLLKHEAASELPTAIREVLRGNYYVSPMILSNFPNVLTTPTTNPGELFGGLTRRQREVLQLIAEGKQAKEVAAILKISTKTVEFHKAAIMQELGVRTTAELVRYALEHRMLS